MSMNHSYTHHRSKSVERWITSDRLRSKYWSENCPECDSSFLRFKLNGSSVWKVICFDCEWSEE